MAVGLFVCGNLDKQTEMTVKCVLEPIIKAIDNLVIFDWSVHSLERMVSNINQVKLVKYNINECKDWLEIVKLYKSLLRDNDIDTFIIFKVVLSNGFKRGDMGKIRGFKSNLRKGKLTTAFNFVSSKVLLSKYMFVEVASKLCDSVYHFVLDPQEASFEDVLDFNHFEKLYGMNNKDHKFMPCFERGLRENGYVLDKEIDFVFYCSAATKDREHIANIKDKLESIDKWDVQVNIPRGKQQGDKKVTPLPQRKYYEKLAKSRYTTCIKAYDETAFSMYRFLEAFAHGCLSFVFDDCCLTDVRLTFPQIHDIMKQYLIVKSFNEIRKNIEDWPESKRLGILNKISQTDDIKRVTKMSYVKECWGKLNGVETRK